MYAGKSTYLPPSQGRWKYWFLWWNGRRLPMQGDKTPEQRPKTEDVPTDKVSKSVMLGEGKKKGEQSAPLFPWNH
jgi:hypothetical protein